MFPECFKVSLLDDDTLEDEETLQVVLSASMGFEDLVNVILPLATIVIEDDDRGTQARRGPSD